ncbi:MAG: hypothetical protein AOA65_1917 [Candidatus Bathyarchaeota archaeon BA1]|nr:MAG: hypothetical protein AOA65_1917 [Candidatus Bathyarchaeota archaeon BA1]
MLAPREIVVLVLKDVVYEHMGFPSLEEFLVEKYGFKKIEEKTHEVSRLWEKIPTRRERILLKEEIGGPIVSEEIERKYSSLEFYEGSYLDAKIKVHFLGDITRKRDIVEISEEERYPIYMVEYQMVKLISESGYALQRFIEQLSVDLGLKIREKEWLFHRCEEG